MRNGATTLVRDRLQSWQIDLRALKIDPRANLAKIGPTRGAREAECEAVVAEQPDCPPWVCEILLRWEVVRHGAVRQRLHTMRSYSLYFGLAMTSGRLSDGMCMAGYGVEQARA
eukprot:8802354-Pyramimonas_sp.AAC.1